MLRKTTIIGLLLAISLPAQAQVLESDSLALVTLYDSTDGANWTYTWDMNTPVDTWRGVTVDSGRVTELDLSTNQLTGSIPAELGNLANLTYLYLTNNRLIGSIPAELGNLANLAYLWLNNNQLSGSIPAELGNLSNLTWLFLAANQLTGSMPTELGNLPNLAYLWLNNNQLSGSIPAELGNLASLLVLRLWSNQLTGSIPAELGNLANLTRLYLSSNQLSGSIPAELGNLANLYYLYLSSNQLTGSIPAELGNLANLTRLYLFNNQLSGSIPAELGNLANLYYLYLSSNQLNGSIPAELGNVNLRYIYLDSNQLSGLPDLNTRTILSNLRVENNRLTFEDLEPNIGISSFTYAPQDSLGNDTTIVWGLTGHLTLSVPVSGTANVYQWMKDSVDMPGDTGAVLTISPVAYADSGSYALRITNTIVPDLTLYSRPIQVSVVEDQFPLAVNDTADVPEDSSVTIPVLENDSDPDGDTLLISAISVPAHGTAVIDTGDTSITYTPAPDFFGLDTCSYVINDGKGLLDTGEVFITVTPVNDPPVITSADSVAATEHEYFVYYATATDMEGDSLSWTFDWRPSWLQFDADSISGTPVEGAADTSFRAIVTDSALSDTIVVTLSIIAVNDPPVVAHAPGITVLEGDTVAVTSEALQVFDEDNTNTELQFMFAAQPSELTGEFRLSGVTLADTAHFTQADIDSGRISFAHDGSETTLDSIGFWITDTDGASAHIPYFPITVIPVNDPPEPFALLSPAADTSFFYDVGDDSVFFRWHAAYDPDGDPVTYFFNASSDKPGLFLPDTTTDTTLALVPHIGFLLKSLSTVDTFAVSWNITAHDGTDSTASLNGPFDFAIIIDYWTATNSESKLPEAFALHQNYPNPFNPTTTIRFDLPVATDVHLAVYDLLGREVVRLVDRRMEAGYHQRVWNARDALGRELPTGMYIAFMATPEFNKNIKVVLLK